MGDNIKSLRKENSELLKQNQNLSQEFEQLKSKMASSMVDINLNEVLKVYHSRVTNTRVLRAKLKRR